MAALAKNMVATIQNLALAKYKPIILNRVSSSSQRKGLPTQAKYMREHVKNMGFTTTPIEITVQQSGKSADLKTIEQLKEVLEVGVGPFVVFVRDVPRFGRSTLANLNVVVDTLKPNGVPLIPLDMHQVVGANGTPEAWMVFTFLSAVAESAKASEERARDVGTEAAKQVGLFEGVPQALYPQLYKKEKSLQRRIWEAQPAINNGNMSASDLWKKEGIYAQNGRTIRDRLLHAASHGLVDDLLAVYDAIIVAEKKRGVGPRDRSPASARTRKSKALHRVTVAYLREPEKWPNPLTQGNPQTATFEKDQATGTIDDAIENPQRYQPVK